jgi:hypothetical protein
VKLEVEQGTAGHRHWRLVVTAADVSGEENGLDRRLRVVGGDVRVKLDYGPRRAAAAGRAWRPAGAHPRRGRAIRAPASTGHARSDSSWHASSDA